METAWRAVEHAGIAPSDWPTAAGVFVGLATHDYLGTWPPTS